MVQGQILATKLLLRKFIRKDKVTQAGILIVSDIVKEDNNIVGDVVMTGEGTPQVPIPVKIGQRVIFNKHTAQSLNIEDEPHLLIDVRDVLFFFDPEE